MTRQVPGYPGTRISENGYNSDANNSPWHLILILTWIPGYPAGTPYPGTRAGIPRQQKENVPTTHRTAWLLPGRAACHTRVPRTYCRHPKSVAVSVLQHPGLLMPVSVTVLGYPGLSCTSVVGRDHQAVKTNITRAASGKGHGHCKCRQTPGVPWNYLGCPGTGYPGTGYPGTPGSPTNLTQSGFRTYFLGRGLEFDLKM
eukprot:3014938-Rhodomonas_salina.1